MFRAALLSVISLLFLAAPGWAELTWEKAFQSFQRAPEDGHLEATFAFRNTGRTPVTINRVKTSCGCTTARLARKVYAPGESGEITAKFTFGSRKGAQRKVITVEADDRPEPTLLNLVVTIQESLALSPALVFWKRGEPVAAKTVQLAVAPGVALRVKRVTSSNPRLAAKLETIAAGAQYAVAVTPADTTQKEAAIITVETDFPPDQPRSYEIHARIK